MILLLLQYLAIIQSLLFAGAFLLSFKPKNERFLGYFFLMIGLLTIIKLKSGIVEQAFNTNDATAIGLLVVFLLQLVLLKHFAELLQLRFKKVVRFILIPIVFALNYFLVSTQFKNQIENLLSIWVGFIAISELVLLVYLLVKIQQRIKRLNNSNTANDIYILYWSKWLLYGRLIRITILPFIYLLQLFINISTEDISTYIIPIAGYSCQLLLFSILYYLAFQRTLYFHSTSENSTDSIEQRILEVVIPSKHKPSQLNTQITEEQLLAYKEKLSAATDTNIFIRPNLVLKELAIELRIPINHLSHLINTVYSVNFNEYINKHRVEYAKGLMLEDITQKKTIYAIAKESGFNSEKPFYSAFKQFTGLTPNQFRTAQGK